MLHLEIKHLRLVTHIAEVANLTRAAHMLCLSQPALSKQLAELEEWLGFAMFHRTRKGMCLTDPGTGFHTPPRPHPPGLIPAYSECRCDHRTVPVRREDEHFAEAAAGRCSQEAHAGGTAIRLARLSGYIVRRFVA